MILTLNGAGRDLARIDIGDLPDFDDADLAETGGNLYIYVNGKEYGSLWFHGEEGRLTIELDRFDETAEDWVERNPPTKSVSEIVREAHQPVDWYRPDLGCTCGLAYPGDNGQLIEHWRRYGVEYHDDHGRIVAREVAPE